MGDYDKISKQYKEYGKRATTDWELGHKNVAKLIEPINDSKVLDYGCGNGKFSVYLAGLGAKVVGIDVSASQLKIAEGLNNKEIEYCLDNDSKIETDYREYFDSAVLNFVTCEQSSKENIISILKRVYRLLKSGGSLVILNSNFAKCNGKDFLTHQIKYTPNLKSGCRMTTVLKGTSPIEIPDYYWSKDDYLEMLKEVGFNNLEIFEPLAPNDGHGWKDEKDFPPFLIIKSKKTAGAWNKLFNHERQELKFGKAKIIVDDGVFTCDPTITYSSSMIIENLPNLKDLRVADIGTGSGVLAVMAGLNGAKEVIGTDISDEAVQNASLNVVNNKVANVVRIIKANLFENIEGKFDIISANLPILDEVWTTHGIQVESTLERFLKQAKSFLNLDGKIYLPWGSFADIQIIESLIKKYDYKFKLISVEKLGFTWYLYIILNI